MDEYDEKFAEMQKYIPFVEVMIERLQNYKDRDNREIQLQKMQSLHGILSNSKRKLKIETLQRCEDVLQKLYNKVGKGNAPDLQLLYKQNDGGAPQPSTSSAKAKPNRYREAEQDAEKNEGIDETPESPDTTRSSSPDCQILPIIIPTERNAELEKSKKQNQRSKKIPVITLTDNARTITISSPTDSNPEEISFTEWDMLEESERHTSRNRENRQPSLVATSHDVAAAAKLISNSLPQRVNESRNYSLDSQDIPTVPVPSLGGSRRLSSVLEKNKLTLDIVAASCARPESPVNVPEVRLNSPDPEILFAKPRATSPRPKDSHSTSKSPSKPPSIPLLFSPPPLSQPPLSMEDIAELLNDEDDGGDKGNKTGENAAKQKETDQISKNFSLSDREKLTGRKSVPITVSPVKSSVISSIGPPRQSNDSHRLAPQALFSGSKFQEPRYADNYERHPRQRDAHSHESMKDKSTTNLIIPEENLSQIPVILNSANKADERNVPLYQRRSNIPESRMDAGMPRPENEFVRDNVDYYNIHANQMQWGSSTAGGDQFGNNQWTPSSYGGMTNVPLQPTQHSFQRPMEPQFRQNQFPPTLPAGPRPLVNPTVRPENIQTADMPALIPPIFPQYRNIPMPQGSYDPAFSVGRPTEYPHIRTGWENPANIAYENVIPCGIQVVENPTTTSHPRPNTPWGTMGRDRDRSNRGQGRDGYYERNRTEVRPGFNRDGRRPDWSRDGHSDRENLNRFPNRDPRVRTENNATGIRDQAAKETGASARDPRLAKDKHINTSTKAKDTVHNERDPRKRPVTPNTKTTTIKEKPKSQKSSEKEKDKLPKDRMQSPLESLYGVIDTKASQNSGLQKFKIPKIKRPEPPQANRIAKETKKVESASIKPSRVKSNKSKEQKKNNKVGSKVKSKDVASAEVSSSSDSNRLTENSVQQSDAAKEGQILSSSPEKSDNNEIIIETDLGNSSRSSPVKKDKKNESEADGSKAKEEVTQEWIEALIRKSFESGEGKKLVDQAKLIQTLEEVLKARKFKKIKKLIESESESSSDKDETVEPRKTQRKEMKKKRRVIVSDSSDDECLAERLLNTSIDSNDERKSASAIFTGPKNSEENLEVAASSNNSSTELTKLGTRDKECVQDNSDKNKDEYLRKKSDKNDRAEDGNENIDVQSGNDKEIRLEDSDKEKKQTEDNQDKVEQSTLEKSKDSTESSMERMNPDSTKSSGERLDQDKDRATQSVADIADSLANEVSNDKPKAKTKRRNSLEMLQEDIKEMFISEGVVSATGHRTCRLSKESQSPAGMSPSTSSTNFKKDETSITTEKTILEPNAETNESVANNAKSRKSLRSRNVEESSKPKVNNKKNVKRAGTTRSLHSKKSTVSSDSEDDQPLALRIEKLLNLILNEEMDRSEESNDAVRRSKRILRKDVVKEPRVVVEKADIMIDSSKVMFDSSSDESFGIDVSELAAAVDISLRPDKQSDQDSIDTVVSRRRRNVKSAGKRKWRSRKSSALTDDKSEDEMSFTDEDESVVSDFSMSSSMTAGKRTSSGAARTTAKEELLSNILIGLVPMTENNTSIDKGSEGDLEDASDPLAIEPSVKKSSVRKKKKKSSWKMGIVTTKKKKKKTASRASSKTAQTGVEKTTSETNISTNTVEDRSIVEDNDPATAEKTEDTLGDDHAVVDDANVAPVVKCEDIKPLINTDSFDVDFKDLSNFALSDSSNTSIFRDALIDSFLSIEESKPLVKMDMEETENSNSADLSAANAVADNENKNFKESPTVIYDEPMTELFRNLDIVNLKNYAWGGQDKYKCLLCFFVGKNIVYHYKSQHAESEVLISRFKLTDAETAIKDVQRGATLGSAREMGQMCKFRCRFCCFVTEGATDVALEAFYEHCTTHTGEYRFHCNNCSSQTVAKASMRTHYYKSCRNKTFSESVTEDVVPREGGIFGYLCCTCYYVQLKRQNVESHVVFWHRKTCTKIMKINMSAIFVPAEQVASNKEQSHESASFAVETKPYVLKFESNNVPMDVVMPTKSEGNDNGTNECESNAEQNIQIKEEKTEETPRLSQEESEGPVSTGNLSAFVCPPEVENKEMEIQRERQKTMQEIANNIGILLKNFSKPGLSIIDKLQDKMRTDAIVSPVPECNASADIPETRKNSSLPFIDSPAETVKTEDIIIKGDPLSQPSNQEDLSFTEEMAADKPEVISEGNDKVDMKIRDPLAVMDPSKDNESDDGENSDNEHAPPIFESDSSSEQSDSEQTDVNMILKETSSMNTSSSRDPMLTTIQRLAAQLQNVKPLEPVPEPMLDIKTEIKSEPMSSIPKPPDVVPIASVKRFLAKQENSKCLGKKTLTPASSKNASSPKNFIKLRRLSGDMLSIPMEFSDNQEDSQEFNTDGAQSDSAVDVLKADTEEECSFLKIENVVSLAQRPDNESVIVNNIRKAVEVSPTKSKEIPVLRKFSHPLILKKNVLSQPLPNTNVHITPKTQSVINPSTSPATLNYRSRKIKVIRTPALASQDISFMSFASKLKSAEVYATMLTEPKLAHFFKCMDRYCSFTTDSLMHYSQHYLQHYEEASKKNSTASSDYDKCAYCYVPQNNTWHKMKNHLIERHSHCRYQCGYCFYRAIIPSYVQQHQMMCHPGTVFYYLLGKMQKPVQLMENINRHDYVMPFECKHDCGKIFYIPEAFITHIKTKHLSLNHMYKCHLCNIISTSIEALMSHYKLHGFCKYQCLYCLYGSDILNEMYQHLSAFHFNRLPQVLERSLPPMPSRQKEVIQQLILRTFESEINEGIDAMNADDSKKNTTKKNAANDQISATSSNVEIASNKALSNSANKSREDNFTEAVGDNLENAKVNTNVSIISTKQPTDASLASTSEKISSSAEKEPFLQSKEGILSDYATSQIFQQPELDMLSSMNDTGAADPLEFSNEFNCSDEFVNTNLLDNAEFLKKFTPNSDNIFSKSADKTEDSDIEILDSEEKAALRKIENDFKKKVEPVFPEIKTESKEQVAHSDATVTKCTSEEASAHAANTIAQPKPLTLDDIKDTGRIGHDLYKCGYSECNFTAPNSVLLKVHIKTCNFGEPIRNLCCPHCNKRFIKIGFLLEHMKTHGLKRFGCSLCKLRYSVSYQATAHMKSKHKFQHTKLVPADPTNPSVDGLFIVQAVPFGSAERRTKKRKGAKSGAEQENEKTADNEKLSFSPDEIEQLPRQAIYNREVQCAVCPYTTKVRTNIIRHLQLHAKDETVPESGPVNPVPCLDKKEKMFDKMVNLASSSHQNGRMGAKPKETVKESEVDDSVPKFVPEHKRYVCGVPECNYLTVDEAMLRYHLKALHSEEPYFRCPHCPPPPPGQENQNIAIDKMGIHLKMHDSRLYKCSHCNHHHYHRHVVERHLTDKHPEKRPFVKVVRDIENTENVQQPVQEETEEEVPDPDGNHWKCNLCDFKCVYKADVASHADTIHGETSQYKCTLCSFKTSGKILLEQHINGKHSYDSNPDYSMIYQRIKGVNKRNTEVIEQGGQDEPFDTTPLWRRSMPRIRHIRGILLEEEIDSLTTNETPPATSKLSLGKRKSDAEIVTKPAKIKSTAKLTYLDENNKQFKEKSKRSLSYDKLFGEEEGEGQAMKEGARGKVTSSKSVKDSKVDAGELSDVNDSDVGRFGPYGKPDANMYVCTLCNHFKTKYKHDMRDHLYRELNYARWHCKACGYLSVNRKSLLQHFAKRHNEECPEHEPLSPDNAIEDWVMTLLKKQTDMIKAYHNMNVIYGNVAMSGNTNSSPDVSPVKIPTDKRTVNLASTISSLQNNILEDANKSNIDTDDGDSRDNEDLVIDMKEDESFEDRSNEDKSENDKPGKRTDDDVEKTIICKHCNMKFTRQRGFKLHVQCAHLKRLGLLCPYCDRSTNSETIMRQHIRAKHPNDPEKIIHNPDAWGNTKLSNEFWEKEYGLYSLKTKKRKLNTENNAATATTSSVTVAVAAAAAASASAYAAATASAGNRLVKCELCSFTAMNYTGLKSHMRTHAIRKYNLRCQYCTYSCFLRAEMLEHWESNHPSLPMKFKELPSTAGPSTGEAKSRSPQKRNVDALKNTEEERNSAKIYGCFYCNLRSISLRSVKQHWNLMHKELKSSETGSSVKFPFKYKEILVQKLSRPTKKEFVELDKAKQAGTLSPIIQQSGWICQWCDEFCETIGDKIRHHNMFHSHLPPKWQEQQQQQNEQDQSKDTSVRLPAYNAEKYATNSKSVPSFESVVETMFTKHARQPELHSKNENDQSRIFNASTSTRDGRQAVARKSTTKSIVPCARPGPRVFKAVARKSTNPRYPPSIFAPRLPTTDRTNTEYEEENVKQSKSFSHYGRPSSPVNLEELNTYMVVGGHRMRVNCLTLATLIDIKPRVLLKDIKKDPKYAVSLSI